MKIITAIALFLVSCSSPRQVILRMNRGDCVRIDKISRDVELIILNCETPRDTILTIKDVAIYDYPAHGLKINSADIETLYVGTILLKYPPKLGFGMKTPDWLRGEYIFIDNKARIIRD